VADGVLEMMDAQAKKHGLWDSNGASDNASPQFGNVNNPVVKMDNINPFAGLIELGYRKIQLAIDYWGVALIYASYGTGIEAITSILNPSNLSGVFPNTGRVGGMIGTVGLAIALFFVFVAGFALMAGVFLAFLIPLMPFVHFFYAFVTWCANIIEAVICMPLFALAFLTPKGEGFMGQKSRHGLAMLMQILLRPILTIIGLIGALLIFYVSVRFLNGMYNAAVNGVANFMQHSGVSFVARMTFGIFHVALVYVCANMSFKMIDHIPRRALQWMGEQANEERYHDDQNVLQTVTTQTSGQAGEVISRPVTLMGSNLRLR
jgi:conjugal transfer/type IV secretion protein DotA/TraY